MKSQDPKPASDILEYADVDIVGPGDSSSASGSSSSGVAVGCRRVTFTEHGRSTSRRTATRRASVSLTGATVAGLRKARSRVELLLRLGQGEHLRRLGTAKTETGKVDSEASESVGIGADAETSEAELVKNRRSSPGLVREAVLGCEWGRSPSATCRLVIVVVASSRSAVLARIIERDSSLLAERVVGHVERVAHVRLAVGEHGDERCVRHARPAGIVEERRRDRRSSFRDRLVKTKTDSGGPAVLARVVGRLGSEIRLRRSGSRPRGSVALGARRRASLVDLIEVARPSVGRLQRARSGDSVLLLAKLALLRVESRLWAEELVYRGRPHEAGSSARAGRLEVERIELVLHARVVRVGREERRHRVRLSHVV